MDVPSLEIFKTRLDEALSNPVHGRGLDWVAFKGRFQPKLFCDSIKSSAQTQELHNTTLGFGAAQGDQKELRSDRKEHRPTGQTTSRVTEKPA